MATHESGPDGPAASAELTANLARVEALTAQLMTALARRRPPPAALQGPSHDLFVRAGMAVWAEALDDPAKLISRQVDWWGRTLQHWADAQATLVRQGLTVPADHVPADVKGDKRFASPLWDTHPWFNYVKQQYLITSHAVMETLAGLDHLDAREAKRVAFFGRQILDMVSPTNFLHTNPEALARAVETQGASLVAGLENLVRDVEATDRDVLVTLADRDAFRVGGNIAATKGAVVFRNRLFELIQYAPATETVHRVPLVIFPPWINKFYILDLKEQSSLIRWLVGQGHTLFVVSWKNPDPTYADVGLGDYIADGYLEALRVIGEITGEAKINVTGYCIAGTTLALTLSLLKQRGDDRVNSATFLTTLTDFSDQGEVGVFLDDDFVDGIEAEVAREGILDSFYMSRTFSYLRANDLVYAPAIRSYMMGEAPPAFDLLFWNGDGTNLPARMAVEYLRGLCQRDAFAQGGFDLLGHQLHLSDVGVPVCAVACETDHIAAWRSSFRGVAGMGTADRTFILSQSGHIAGIVNPPSKRKYGHWADAMGAGNWSDGPEVWRASATFNEGSWWPRWGEWLAARAGERIAPRIPGLGAYLALDPAPGTYVTEVPPRAAA